MTTFAVWAPYRERVRLRLGDEIRSMRRDDDGWWRRDEPDSDEHDGDGRDYGFLLDDDDTVLLPDPRSPWQPHGVHGLSRRYDHAAFAWTDQHWTGRTLSGSVLYELHIGTFTPGGTFDTAIDRLDHLVELGVTTVELLPVNAFDGTHNWGYDGVDWFAPHEPYGGPDGLKRFVDACHRRGLAVIIDAVYNHLGPSGAYLPRFGPYLAEGSNTWGRSVNLDGPDSGPVRRYIVDSALAWLRDYHADGLRLDAVHALVDHGAIRLLEQLAVEVDVLATHLNRPLTLIAESDLNDPRLITAREAHGDGLAAQWNDDAHHALHVLLTGETQGYYADFADPQALATVWCNAFYHAGTWSSFRGRRHGRPVDRTHTPGYRFIAYLQNHDQIGNRAEGDRLTATLSPGRLRVGAVLLLTAPFTPMLFMGEEWGARTPWQFFTSHTDPTLAGAVSAGRRAEFARHGWPEGDVPDPQDPATFTSSILDWSEADRSDLLPFYRSLIALRRSVSDLADPRLDRVRVETVDGILHIHRGDHLVLANLTGQTRTRPVRRPLLLGTESTVDKSGDGLVLPPDSAAVLGPESDGGGGRPEQPIDRP